MAGLTLDDVINIHAEIQKRFHISPGANDSLLDSIVQRPNFDPYMHVPFSNVYSKCASLIEGIIKWHPFIDGNKRTGLAVAHAYMQKNNYRIVIPFKAVRFSVLIAQDKKDINEITRWVRALAARRYTTYLTKVDKHLITPARTLLELYKSGQEEKADNILGCWLALSLLSTLLL